MRKLFSLIAAVLFAGSMMATEELKATLDFSTNEAWQFPADAKAIDAASYSDGTYTITLEGTTGNGYRWYSNGSYLLLGKQGATLTLPAFDWKTTKILVYGTSGASEAVKQNIFVGENAVSTETTGAKNVTNEYVIAEDYQEAGNVYAIKVTSAHNTQFSKIEIYGEGEGGGDVPPVEPTPDYFLVGTNNGWDGTGYQFAENPGEEGEYMLDVTFAANDEYKVVGVLDGDTTWYPDGVDNNHVVAEAGDYTVYFRPAGNPEWAAYYFYDAVKVAPEAISLTQFIADKPNTEVTLKDLTVIFATGKNTYVIDEDGVALVMYDASKTYYDGTLAAGTVLSGQKATYTLYNNQVEIIPTNTAETSEGVAPAAVVMEAKPSVEANENQYLHFDSVQVTENGGKFYIYEDVLLYGASSDLKPAEAGDYNMEGIFINYKGNTPELIITALEKIETPVVPGDTIVLDYSEAFAYVDNSYFEEYRSTDIVFTTIPLNDEYDLVGDGDFLQIEIYPENPNDITGLYSIEDENLDDYYTYLMHVNGTDTAAIDFVDGTVAIEVLAVDKENMLAQLSLNANLLGNDANVYVVEGTFVLFYDFLEEEQAVENVNEAAKTIKRIEMGNVVIYKNGVKYSVNGQIVK